jgi:hypothetical protein
MSTIELKKLLIERIQLTDDQQLLEEAYRLLEIADDTAVYVLSEAQERTIALARQQMEAGQSLTHEQANREIEEWLEK